MEGDSRGGGEGKATLKALMRERIWATVETIVDEELGAARSQRAGEIRAGYRHGRRERTLTAGLGATTIAKPGPVLAVIDGDRRSCAALKVQWPKLAIQRCASHRLWDLFAKAPAHLREELAEDYRRMIYARTCGAVAQARIAFTRKSQLRCKAVSTSFAEAGDELFT